MDAGVLTPAQAAVSPLKNLVTRAWGVEDGVLMEVSELHVEVGDIYLMCSDGLSDMMSDSAVATVLRTRLPLPPMADELVAQANRNGGRDNITVLLIQAVSTQQHRGLMSRWLGKR